LILGTTDNQPLEFHVNGTLAFRLEPGFDGPPNVVGGSDNIVDPTADAATIAGGFSNFVNNTYATVGAARATTAAAIGRR